VLVEEENGHNDRCFAGLTAFTTPQIPTQHGHDFCHKQRGHLFMLVSFWCLFPLTKDQGKFESILDQSTINNQQSLQIKLIG